LTNDQTLGRFHAVKMVAEVSHVDGIRAISDEEVAEFVESGWVRLDGLVTEELAADLLDAAKAVMSAPDDGSAAPPTAAGGAGATVKGLRRVVDVGAFYDRRFLAAEGLEPFASVAFSARLAANVQAMMQRNVGIRYRNDIVACKMPAGQSGSDRTNWHQDIRFMPHDRSGHVNVWIALDEVTPERGALRFLTKSHREGLAGWAPDLAEARPDIFERYELSAPLHLKPGDATIHHSYMIHGAPANATDEPRWAYIIGYFPTDVRYTGTQSHDHDELGLVVGDRIDHPKFPVVFDPDAA
jgi:ectoine hydroxylase-related dioxygenase (phytanoyl-CoA dioxygenase family)